MRILVQRVSQAEVRIRSNEIDKAPRTAGNIGPGLLLFVGFTHSDSDIEVRWMVEKILGLRIFSDLEGRMNQSVIERHGAIMVVSQFTLYGDTQRGRRPSFVEAATPEAAVKLYDGLILTLRERGIDVQCGEFGAMMDVSLTNDGPVTFWIEREPRSAP